MNTEEKTETLPAEELLEFFKALADRNRLKIVGLLAQQDLSVEQMAEMLGVRSPTVSHHLNYLQRAGLVSARAEGYYNIYHLEAQTLEETARRLLAKETLPAVAVDVDRDAYDRKVLKTYLDPDGTLNALPTQEKKLLVIVRYAVERFEPDRRYSEKEVNEVLAALHPDTAFLRRSLIEYKFMHRSRDGREYWLAEK